MKIQRRIQALLSLAVLGLMAFDAMPVLASVSQGFATSGQVAVGSLVALNAKSNGQVETATSQNADRLIGIAVSPSSSNISLGSGQTGQVQVATTGSANAFVSTAGGAVKVGDAIAVSPLAGVGQKAVGKVRIIGTAQADFSGSGDGITRHTVDTATGRKEVAIGQIPVVIAVTTYASDDNDTYTVPSWLQKFSNSLAGKAVSPVRIVLAGLILIVALISVTVLLYAAVRNSIISIGRNPLSRGAVFKGLLQVVGIAALLLGVATGAMYWLITK